MARNPVLKLKDIYVSGYMIEAYRLQHNLNFPFSFPVAFKEGKRRKIKSCHVDGKSHCDCCGTRYFVRFNGREFETY